MSVKSHPCDIGILTLDQAWDNYCSALHLARRQKALHWREFWHKVASESLDRYFERLDQRARNSFALMPGCTLRDILRTGR